MNVLEQEVVPRIGRYEADVTATALAMLAVRHAEGVAVTVLMAPHGYIPAAACARASFEAAVTAMWLQKPRDAFDREGRWLGYYKAMERYYRNLADDVRASSSATADDYDQAAAAYGSWRTHIEGALPSGRVVSRPAVPVMLEELDARPLYSVYRAASQLVHGEPPALALVQRTHYEREDPSSDALVFRAAGRVLEFGAFAGPEAVTGPLRMASYGVTRATVYLADRSGTPGAATEALVARHSDLLNAAAQADGEREPSGGDGDPGSGHTASD